MKPLKNKKLVILLAAFAVLAIGRLVMPLFSKLVAKTSTIRPESASDLPFSRETRERPPREPSFFTSKSFSFAVAPASPQIP